MGQYFKGCSLDGSVNLIGWKFSEETRNANLTVVPVDVLERIKKECQECIATEYPETMEGTYWASDRIDQIEAELNRRVK